MGTISQRNMLSFNATRNWVASRPRKLGVANPPRASASGAAAPAGAAAAPPGPRRQISPRRSNWSWLAKPSASRPWFLLQPRRALVEDITEGPRPRPAQNWPWPVWMGGGEGGA